MCCISIRDRILSSSLLFRLRTELLCSDILTINLGISDNNLFHEIYVFIPLDCHKREMLMQRIMHIMTVLHYYNTHKSWAA